MTRTVVFYEHDLNAIRTARRALALLADAVDEAGGMRGVAIGLALDDLELLADRMQAEIAKANDRS
jgi:hypothetical protein